MNASFLVDGNPIGAGLRECADEFVRSLNHEMTIKRDVYGFAREATTGGPIVMFGTK
jgi:hypothetical protein